MAEDDDQQPKKKSKLKLILLLFFVLLLLGGGGAWYYFFSGLPGSRAAAAPEATGETRTIPQEEPKDLTTTVLPTFLVNLADPLGRRYIKLTLEVEVVNKEVILEIEKQMPKIRDGVIMLLSSKSYADLMPTESKIVLKDELVGRINQALGGPKVTRIFFTDLVIQ
ncbi:flagellar basal body-associated FliL family protein [Desulfovibrio sp. OttesenSCG-928-I05]|nr:flagellar basal body-associated FliL family protein [Desulfovibrio sp. OttesenSCG-928-I05]